MPELTGGIELFRMFGDVYLKGAEEVKKQIEALDKKASSVAETFKDIGSKISTVGGALTKNLTVPLIAVGTLFEELVRGTSKAADKLTKLSTVTGISTERLQELQYAGAKLDIELETITGAQSKLIRAMNAANDGTKAQKEAFEKLGVAIVDSNGNLRDSNIVFNEAITALGKMENPTQRDALALELFGRSALELNPLIKAGADELARLTEEAHKNGAVLSGEAVKALDNYNDSLEALKLSLVATASRLAIILLPVFEKMVTYVQDKIVPAIQNFIKCLDDIPDGIKNFALGLAIFAAAVGPVLVVIGKFVSGIGFAIGAVKALIGFLGRADCIKYYQYWEVQQASYS